MVQNALVTLSTQLRTLLLTPGPLTWLKNLPANNPFVIIALVAFISLALLWSTGVLPSVPSFQKISDKKQEDDHNLPIIVNKDGWIGNLEEELTENSEDDNCHQAHKDLSA